MNTEEICDENAVRISNSIPANEQVYVSVAIDKTKGSITMASFVEGSEAEARAEAAKVRPGLPIFTFRLFDKPSNIKNALWDFLTDQGIPESEHLEVFGLLCQGLREGIKK